MRLTLLSKGCPAALIAMTFALAVFCARADESPPGEPPSYRLENYRAPTPATLGGKPGLTTAEAEDLWRKKEAAFVDVLPQAPRPAGLAPGTIWHDRPRDDIPGSIWLPDTGYGALAPETERYFREGLAKATNGDFDATLVFYCLKNCWMSWNAAKRAETSGYTHVLWYPGGTGDWAEAKLPLERRKPFAEP